MSTVTSYSFESLNENSSSSSSWIGLVKYDCQAVEKTELTVKKGEHVNVREENNTGWCLCKNQNGENGWVPRDFLKRLFDSEQPMSPKESFWMTLKSDDDDNRSSSSRPNSPTSRLSPKWTNTARLRSKSSAKSEDLSNDDISIEKLKISPKNKNSKKIVITPKSNKSSKKNNNDNNNDNDNKKLRFQQIKKRTVRRRRMSQSLGNLYRSKSSGAKRGLRVKKNRTKDTKDAKDLMLRKKLDKNLKSPRTKSSNNLKSSNSNTKLVNSNTKSVNNAKSPTNKQRRWI